MKNKIQTITVIGDGGWGTTLAIHLAKKNYPVELWGPFPQYVKRLAQNRYNSKFLPGIRFPKNLHPNPDLGETLTKSDLIVFAVPSKFTSSVLKLMKATHVDFSNKTILSVTKGIENKSLKRMSELIYEHLGKKLSLAVLSGPTIAGEVAKEIPSTAVIASKDIKTAKRLQEIVNTDKFRIYTNTDVAGVELGGSIKNIIAVACGVCDGLGFGTNTKAAIVTRGLTEMARLGKAMGAQTETFNGLSGLGDLVTTCFSPNSRNRTVGEQLGKGKSIQSILKKMEMVAEGVETAKSAYHLSQKLKISMPITTEVYKIVYKGKKPSKAVEELMGREVKSE